MRLPEFNGSLVIFINGEAIGIVATGIPEKMYGFIELQNDCERICITKCHGVKLVSDSRLHHSHAQAFHTGSFSQLAVQEKSH